MGGGRAQCHNEVEAALDEKSAQIIKERPFVLELPKASALERGFIKIDRIWRLPYQFFTECSRDGAPGRKVGAERMQQENPPGLAMTVSSAASRNIPAKQARLSRFHARKITICEAP